MKNSKNLSLFGRTGKLQRLFLIALFSVLAIGAYAQSKTVSGTVVDQTGEPIIGANVVVKGTTNGIVTDLDGRFTLSNVPDIRYYLNFFHRLSRSGDFRCRENEFASDITGR